MTFATNSFSSDAALPFNILFNLMQRINSSWMLMTMKMIISLGKQMENVFNFIVHAEEKQAMREDIGNRICVMVIVV